MTIELNPASSPHAAHPSGRRSTSSAFSRLANIALSTNTTTTGTSTINTSPGSATGGGIGPVGSPSPLSSGGIPSFPSSLSTTNPTTTLTTTAPTTSRGALDALETIANADVLQGHHHARKRLGSTDSRLSELSSPAQQSGGGPTATGIGGATASRFKRDSWNTAAGARDSSHSRSRERERERSDSSGFNLSSGQDSPLRGYWGSSLAAAGESHFFQPGAGSSGFSFEHPHSSLSTGASFWDGSYRSSITGSPSLFGTSSSRNNSSAAAPASTAAAAHSQLSNARYPWNAGPDSATVPYDYSSSSSSPLPLPVPAAHRPLLSRAQSPTTLNLARSSSPLGGGRKLKEFSRGMRHTLTSATAGREVEKGLIGIAKPRKNGIVGNGNDLGRVAVAGKHSLKILKVPYGPSASSNATTRRPQSTSYANVARSSSIADRRSRSRGPKGNSPSSGSSAGGSGFIGATRRDASRDGGATEEEDVDAATSYAENEPQVVEEVMDVRHASRLSPSYLFQDVRWGYGATSSKLATACTNGAVILWDLSRDGGSSKLDQVKYEHDRAVNRIVFGGQTGNWLMSGGQDGQMKLWDIRESRPSSMILKASSPVRHLSFSPSASQPFTLLAACASGTLIRYDVRHISRQNGGATDRIAGHIGSCLAMDWRDGFDCEKLPGGAGGVGVTQETAGGGKEGGWVVTGGIDSTIKIWDFSLPTLATKPIRTLYPSQPVQSVSWHPTHGSEIASSPLPSLSLGSTSDKADDTAATSFPRGPDSSSSPRGDSNGKGSRVGSGNNWKNEISIWDSRRPYFPKLSIKTEEPTSSILFNDDETIWATSKTSTTFNQYDTASDSYSLLDCVDRPSAAWNSEGDFMFVDDARTAFDVPFDRSRNAVPVNSDKYLPQVFFAAVTDLDPDFSSESFTQLANSLQLTGDFDEICENNIHVSFLAGRPDAAQVWAVIKTWFGQSPLSTPDTPPSSPPPEHEPNSELEQVEEDRSAQAPITAAPDWILSPTSTTYSDAASKSNRHHRFSLSSMRSSPSSRRQASTDTFDSSVTALPRESIKKLLDTFSEESTASETDPSAQSPYYPEFSSTSSDSDDHDVRNVSGSRRARHAALGALPTNRLAASLSALADSQQHGLSSDLSRDDGARYAARTPSRLGSRRNSSSSSSSTSGDSSSSSIDDRAGPVSGVDGTARRSSRSAKIAALHASLVANRSRRPSAGQSSERRPLRSRDSSTLAGRKSSRKQSAEGNVDSRRGSAARMATNRTMSSTGKGLGGVDGAPREEKKVASALTSKDLTRQAAAQHAEQAFEIVKQQLKATLVDYADRGDSQMCAVVCCVLQVHELGLEPLWIARVTKAYLDMLRRLDLHVPAATLNKYCSTESLRNLTQDSVVFHTACGRCGKGIEQPPFDYCPKCRLIITRCGICHLAVDSLYLFCACCGHGLHEDCAQNFAGSHSISVPQTPNTVPSTPGIATPLRNWLFREGSSVVDSEEGEGFGEDAAERLAILLSRCPSACSHSC